MLCSELSSCLQVVVGVTGNSRLEHCGKYLCNSGLGVRSLCPRFGSEEPKPISSMAPAWDFVQ